MFQNNQREFDWGLVQEGERSEDEKPNTDEWKKFCGSITGQSVEHKDGRWWKDLQSKIDSRKQKIIDITIESLKETEEWTNAKEKERSRKKNFTISRIDC